MPKTVTVVKPRLVCVVNPVGLQPINNIIMAGEQNNLTAPFSPRFGKSRGSYLCNLSVDNARKFIHDSVLRTFANKPGKAGAELLPITEHVERPEPCWNVAEANGRKCTRHGVKISVRINTVHNGLVDVPPFIKVVDRLAKYPATD